MAKNNNLGDFLTDIANAIRTKKGTSGTIPAQDFSSEILSIPSGGGGNEGGWDISYEEYALALYYRFGELASFPNAWQDSENSKTVLYDIPLSLAAPNQEMGGMNVDLYVGTDGTLEQLYNDCLNEVLPAPIDSQYNVYLVNDRALNYVGDVSSYVGMPMPVFSFGGIASFADAKESFVVVDLTPMQMGLGIVLGKLVGNSITNNSISIQQGFSYDSENGIILPNIIENISDGAFNGWETNNQPLVIPNSVTIIGKSAFSGWTSNNQPLTIPNSVTSIGRHAFASWTSNTHPLVIPNSVTSVDGYAFHNWTSNNQPLVIPDSITSIGGSAFFYWSLVPYVEIKAIIPPSLANSSAFSSQNNAPIYVPDASVDDYKTATNWVRLSSRIFPLSEKP